MSIHTGTTSGALFTYSLTIDATQALATFRLLLEPTPVYDQMLAEGWQR